MKKFLHVAVIASLLAPAVAFAQQVKVDYDRSVTFTRFKTYSWAKGRAANNPLIDRMIVEAIDRQLMSKGLTQVETGADLNVIYYASLDSEINTSAVGYMRSVDWTRWGAVSAAYKAPTLTMPVGKMLLDLVDVSAEKLVWRGNVKVEFTANNGERRKLINSAAEKMFKKFPPPPR